MKRGKEAPPVNARFRAWTRGTSFTINMGKTQVITLVAIAVSQERWIGLLHPSLRYYVTAIRGLEERGLVERPRAYAKTQKLDMIERAALTLASRYVPSEAGEHVLSLLKLSGVYSELRDELLAYEPGEHGYYSEHRHAR